MSEPKFIRVEESDEEKKRIGDIWGKLFDESSEGSKDTILELRLLLIYLFRDLGGSPDAEKTYFNMLEDDVAKEIAESVLEEARKIISE